MKLNIEISNNIGIQHLGRIWRNPSKVKIIIVDDNNKIEKEIAKRVQLKMNQIIFLKTTGSGEGKKI